jgi:hypothetical protein
MIGICNLLFGKDPVFDDPVNQRRATKAAPVRVLLEQIWQMMTIPTFVLIIVQVMCSQVVILCAWRSADPWCRALKAVLKPSSQIRMARNDEGF